MQISEVLSLLEGVRRSGSGWIARCPTHEDRLPSLTVGVGRTGKVLLHCFAGCTYEEIALRLGIPTGEGEPPPRPRPRATRYPALRAWRKRKLHLVGEPPFDKLWLAACWEESALRVQEEMERQQRIDRTRAHFGGGPPQPERYYDRMVQTKNRMLERARDVARSG